MGRLVAATAKLSGFLCSSLDSRDGAKGEFEAVKQRVEAATRLSCVTGDPLENIRSASQKAVECVDLCQRDFSEMEKEVETSDLSPEHAHLVKYFGLAVVSAILVVSGATGLDGEGVVIPAQDEEKVFTKEMVSSGCVMSAPSAHMRFSRGLAHHPV